MTAESYRTSHVGRGPDYHATFEDLPHRAMVWRLERQVLKRIASALPKRQLSHLDFACGTGRVIGLLAPHVARSVGLDISPTMLKVAADRVVGAEFVTGDVTVDPVLVGERFDLITAFRFFPNAEPALRLAAMRALCERLAPGGSLVFNNHLNHSSSTYALVRLLRRPLSHMMSAREVKELVAACGLKIVAQHGLALLPLTERRMPRAASGLFYVEAALARIRPLADFGQNIIYVCKRLDAPMASR